MDTSDTYNLTYTTTRPVLTAHDIKHRETRQFFDREFLFTVIGDSHYVGCEGAGYHELLTCKPLERTDPTQGSAFRDREGLTKTVPLTVGHQETLQHVLNGTGVRTELRGEPLSAFGPPESFDIAYRFGADAYTTIDIVADDTYRTYHTHPEHDLALRTETTLFAVPPAERE